jgi:uncharacterized protein
MGSRLPPAVDDAVSRFASFVRSRFAARVRELVLFGSHARGDANEESDVDVLVVIDGLDHAERNEIIDAASDIDTDLEDAVGLSVFAHSTEQAVAHRRTGRRIWRDIEREGVAL